jgi:hypothetical protein
MEGGGYRLQIDVRSETVLDDAIRKIRGALEEGKIARLLGILKGENQGGTRG